MVNILQKVNVLHFLSLGVGGVLLYYYYYYYYFNTSGVFLPTILRMLDVHSLLLPLGIDHILLLCCLELSSNFSKKQLSWFMQES